jgi:hypothetical protein
MTTGACSTGKPLFWAALICALQALSLASASPFDDEVPPRGALKLGVGFDSITGVPRTASCVKVMGPPVPTSTGIEGQTTRIFSVKRSEDMRDVLRISASASMNGAWASASASVNFFTSNTVSSYSENLFVYSRVMNPRELLNVVGLKKAYESYGGYANFRQSCGDSFVAGQITGGEIFALYKLATVKTNASQLFVAKLNASSGGANLDASTEKQFEDTVSSEEYSVSADRTATSDTLPTTPAELITYIKGYAEKVRPCTPEEKKVGCHTKQAVVRYILLPYDEFIPPLNKTDPKALQEELRLRQFVDATARYSDKLRDRIATLNYSLENPRAFVDGGDTIRLQSERDKTSAQFNAIINTTRVCLADARNCQTPQWPEVPYTPHIGSEQADLDPKRVMSVITEARGETPVVVDFKGGWYFNCDANNKPIANPARVSQECAEFYNPSNNKYFHLNPVEGQKYKVPPGYEVRFYFFDSYHADNCVDPNDHARYRLFEPLLTGPKDYADVTGTDGPCATDLSSQH